MFYVKNICISSQGTDGVDSENPQWQLFEAVQTVANNSGTLLSEPFWKLPSKRFYPDYYREIKNPVSLTQIKRKLMQKSYGTVSEVAGDMTIMFENAKKYNMPTSKLYKVSIHFGKSSNFSPEIKNKHIFFICGKQLI